MEVRFEQLGSLHWLWAVAALAVLVVVGFRLRGRGLRRFASEGLVGRIVAGVSRGRQYARATLVLLALTAIVAAMIDPRWGVTFQTVQPRGIDIVIVLDLSKSMLAEDVRPNRVDRAKQFIADLVERLGGDRIGLVTFAGTATISCPLTVDYGAFLLTLDVVSVDAVPRGGSLLGDAIRVAGTAFTDEVPDHKAIIIFSDGEDHGSYPRQAVETLTAKLPVPIYTVGIGDTEDGATIPVPVDGRRGRGRTNLTYEGQEVWSKLDPSLLRTIALDSGGAYVPVGTGTVDMGQVYEEKIEPVAKREFEATQRKQHHARYQWFAGLALLLLLLESLMGDGRAPRSRTLHGIETAARRRSMPGQKPQIAATMLVLLVLPFLIGAAPSVPAAPPAPAAPGVAATPDAAADASPTKLAREAARAMGEARYDDAIGLYDALRGALPDKPEIPYNQGVAAYRAGALDRAADYFRQTLDIAQDPMLRARSAYNLGTTAHRRTLDATTAPPDAAGAPPAGPAPAAGGSDPMAEAMEELGRAIEHYREALDADPGDMDARANAELAWNLRKQLEEMQQQQQQGGGEGDEQQDQQDQPPDENQQQQQGEQPQDQQQQDQQQQQQQEQDQQSQEQQQSEQDTPEPQDGEQQDPGEQNQEQQDQQQPTAGEEPEDQEPRRMTREEAERLLQSVRDKERRRREELARREASRYPPVTKDW